MRKIFLATAYNLTVFMTDSADHISGKTGLTLTITASKDGAAFGSITPTVTELATGWYKLALTTSHSDTLGDLALHITSTGADPTDLVLQVVPVNVAANLTQIGGVTQSATDLKDFADIGYDPAAHKVAGVVMADTTTTLTNLPAVTTDWLTAAGVKADAVAKIQAGLSTLTAQQVWEYATRGLTTFGSLVADIATAVWGAATRTLSAFGFTPSLDAVYDAAKTAASQTSVDDLPTNAELATALGTADDAVLAAIAALNNLSSAHAQSAAAAALTAYDGPTKAELDSAVAALATAAQMIKLLAAVYDTATASGSVITLSNGATQTVTAAGRTTAEA